MTKKTDRLAFEAEFLRLYVEGGPDFDRRPLVKRFVEETGTSQTSLYRWAQGLLDSGRAATAYAEAVQVAAETRAALPEPELSLEVAVMAELPPIAALAALPAAEVIDIMGILRRNLLVGDELIRHARNAETGGIRNSKLMIGAIETIRRTVETIARVNDSLEQTRQLQAFHSAIFEMLKQEAPETAERVLMRMKQLSSTWASYLEPERGGRTIDA